MRLDLEIVPDGEGWILVEDADARPAPYATREAAFEAVIGSISNALKQGLEVTLMIRAAKGRTLE